MPYLQAVIKEGLRLHPAGSLPLSRVVPEKGATISGHYFPKNVSKLHSDRTVLPVDLSQS